MTQQEKEELQARSIATLEAYDKEHNVVVNDAGLACYPNGKLRTSVAYGLQFPLPLPDNHPARTLR